MSEDPRWQQHRDHIASLNPAWRFCIRDSQTAEILAEGGKDEWVETIQSLLPSKDFRGSFGWLISWRKDPASAFSREDAAE
jgi:hypothetical protein